jgi:2-polyprenyl-6-methoxyphenol hydroxylase-like FAD-dependent oxidoreductase
VVATARVEDEIEVDARDDAARAPSGSSGQPHEVGVGAAGDFPKLPVWHHDQMLVIGDAAHVASPSSGQGASMALEDAVVLGKALRDSTDVASAFRSYEAARRSRVERVVAEGKKSGTERPPARSDG